MAEVFIPVLHYFAMNNIFTGSCGLFRFRAEPNVIMLNQKEVNMEESSVHAEFWHGVNCYELSQMEGEKTFPMSEEGMSDMKAWLEANI